MITNYRKYYNPIYKLWELEREQPSGFIEGATTWVVVAVREKETEIDNELERLTTTTPEREVSR